MAGLTEYAKKYQGIQFDRNEKGVLEVTLHTKGESARWGSSLDCLHAELGPAFQDIANDAENRVVILTGTGDNFIAEADPKLSFHESSLAEMWPRIQDEGLGLLNNLLAIPVPMIAAVNGPAYIHAELAVLCDVVLSADHAEFADLTHFVAGAVPGDGVHTVWPMLLGPNRGRYFLLTGERIKAAEAKQLGFVAEVMEGNELMPRARELANEFAQKPLAMLRYTRSLLVRELRRRMFDELANGLAHEALATLVPPK